MDCGPSGHQRLITDAGVSIQDDKRTDAKEIIHLLPPHPPEKKVGSVVSLFFPAVATTYAW